MVYEYITEDLGEKYINNILNTNAVSNSNTLNKMFENKLKLIETDSNNTVSPEEYINLVNEIYVTNDNFFVGKVDRVPIEINDYYTPFFVIDKQKIKKYIESSEYYPNDVAIDAIKKKLNINIIPIEVISIDGINTFRVRYNNLIINNKNNNWDKFMFVYYKSGNYNLIGFNYKISPNDKSKDNINYRVTIYNRNQENIDRLFTVPIYMSLIIYGCSYSNKSNSDKKKFAILKSLMQDFDLARKKMNDNSGLSMVKQFKINFNNYFPSHDIKQHGGKSNENDDNIKSYSCYKITINLQLIEKVEGKEISPKEFQSLKCKTQLNSIYQSYAEMTGQKYNPPPDYTDSTS